MDIINTPKYEDLQRIYSKYFSLGYLNTDFNTKAALVSLTCYLVDQLKKKKPDVTHYQVLYKINNGELPEDFIKGLAVVCSDWAYGCKEFPTFGIATKDIPAKIKEILCMYIPF
jgi:hypothetical protein